MRSLQLTWNTRLGLLYTGFEFACASVRAGDVLSGYLYLVTGKNSTVGFIQGVNGLLQARITAGGGLNAGPLDSCTWQQYISRPSAAVHSVCIVQLCAAFPAGYLADRWRRDALLRVSAGIGAVAGASLLAAVSRSHVLCGIMVGMGVVNSLV